MAVPDFQKLMRPAQSVLARVTARASRDMRTRVAATLGLGETEWAKTLPSGKQTRFANRAAWPFVYLSEAELVQSARRGHYRITDRGRSALASG